MKSPGEIKPGIIKLYTEIGKDVTELRYFSEKGMLYYVTKNDGTGISLSRKDIDDYMGTGDQSTKYNIIIVLNNFRHYVR